MLVCWFVRLFDGVVLLFLFCVVDASEETPEKYVTPFVQDEKASIRNPKLFVFKFFFSFFFKLKKKKYLYFL